MITNDEKIFWFLWQASCFKIGSVIFFRQDHQHLAQFEQVSLPVQVPTVSQPFTARPTKKSSRHRTTITPSYTPPRLPVVPYTEERPELKEIPFTVRPTIKSNPYGSTVLDHDVKLKSPFEDQIHNFGGKFNQVGKHPAKPAHASYNVDQADFGLVTAGDGSTDYMDGGYKGLPNFNFPGLHDDRPDFSTQNPIKKKPGKIQEHYHKYPSSSLPNKGVAAVDDDDDDDSDFQEYADEATFGDLKFKLPNGGSFPDQPSLSDSMLRDLPGLGIHPNYPSTEDTLIDLKDLYLKNPFGNDFIRLEVDTERFRHNKTASGGIHHIPLLINGYPDIVKKTRRNDDTKKTIERKSDQKPTSTASTSAPKQSETKTPARSQKPKSINRMGSVNVNVNAKVNANDRKDAETKPKLIRTSPPEPVQKNVQRQQVKKAPPPPVQKKVPTRKTPSSATPSTTSTTKTPFVSKVQGPKLL